MAEGTFSSILTTRKIAAKFSSGSLNLPISRENSLLPNHAVKLSRDLATLTLMSPKPKIEKQYSLKRSESVSLKWNCTFVGVSLLESQSGRQEECACRSYVSDETKPNIAAESFRSNSIERRKSLERTESVDLPRADSVEDALKSSNSGKENKSEFNDLMSKIEMIDLQGPPQEYSNQNSDFTINRSRKPSDITNKKPTDIIEEKVDKNGLASTAQEKIETCHSIQEDTKNNTNTVKRRGVKRKRGFYFPKSALEASMARITIRDGGQTLLIASRPTSSKAFNREKGKSGPIKLESIANTEECKKDAESFSKPKVYNCLYCRMMYFNINMLLKHMRLHMVKFPKCCRCHKLFRTIESRKKHQRLCVRIFAMQNKRKWGATF